MQAYVSHRSVWRNPIHFIAFGFGAGTLRFMPGTFGSLMGIILYLLLFYLPLSVYLSLVLVFFVLGVWFCGKTADDLQYPDYGGIVWDEIVGMLLVLTVVPPSVIWIIIAFALFRLFDIWKPWPIGWLNKHIKNGFGIMLDDAIAAIYAIFILELIKLALLQHG